MTAPSYIVFVDESGDHSLESINPEWPLFVLCFSIIPVNRYIDAVTPAVRRLKFDTFGHDQVVLHEHDIRKRSGAFARMDQQAREAFLLQLTDLIAATEMTVVAVVIDKQRHRERYSVPEHPYHLAMQFGLERIATFLDMNGCAQEKTWVVFEARGAREDQALELAFRRVCDGDNRDRRALPLHIPVADKKSNSEGLQLADLMARPVGLSVLRPRQSNRAWEIIRTKLFAGRHNCVTGNGLKVFP